MLRPPIWLCSRCKINTNALLRRFASSSIIPSLVEKARWIQKQHTELTKQLETGYVSSTSKKIGEILPVVEALKQWDSSQKTTSELRSLLNDPSTDAELRDLANQDLAQSTYDLTNASQSLAEALMPKHPFAQFPCLIEIRPGIGGGEAAIFARDLQKMYQSFCQHNRLPCTLLKEDTGTAETEESLYEAILEINVSNAYKLLRSEAGIHRVQRVPATETKGRTHTSTVAVMVLPSFLKNDHSVDVNDPSSDFYLDPKEVKKEYMRANGAGGQHVNKTESAVRLTHMPTGIVVSNQEMRHRAQNEDRAWTLLRSRVAQTRREQREDEALSLRRSVIGVSKVGRADKIRTYNWQQQRVTDHRSGLTIHGLDGVLDGGHNLTKLMDSVRQWQTQVDVENMI